MSISTEITRLQTAKSDIKAAIEAKGVTVPAATLLGEYDDLIGQISGGSSDLVDLIEGNFSGDFSNSDLTKIKTRGFSANPGMTSADLPNVTHIGDRPFESCSNLVSVSIPKLTIAGGWFFTGLSKLTGNYIFPLLTSFGNELVGSSKINIIVLPAITNSITTSFAQNDTELTAADFGPGCTGISQNAFNGCTSFTTLILRMTSVKNLNNINTFANSPFGSGGSGGTIYIPKALYDHLGDGTSYDYKADTNWSVIDSYGTITWAAIEGSYYETHYADGTVIE